MAYLSKVVLNPLRTGAQSLLNSPQRMHAAVMGGLPPSDENRRLLWRLERKAHRAEMVILTPTKPSWQHLVEQAGWPDSDEGEAKSFSLDPVLSLLAKGREFAFKAKLNPTSTTKTVRYPTKSQQSTLEKGKNVRVGHRTAPCQIGWFLQRAADGADSWGFTVGPSDSPRVALMARERLAFNRRESRVVLDTATFEGVLTVTDPSVLRDRLLSGIGGGKAYGCGLLTLAPVS